MPVQKIFSVGENAAKTTKNIFSKQQPQNRTVINSFEFQAGFIPEHKKKGFGTLGKIDNSEHFINSII